MIEHGEVIRPLEGVDSARGPGWRKKKTPVHLPPVTANVHWPTCGMAGRVQGRSLLWRSQRWAHGRSCGKSTKPRGGMRSNVFFTLNDIGPAQHPRKPAPSLASRHPPQPLIRRWPGRPACVYAGQPIAAMSSKPTPRPGLAEGNLADQVGVQTLKKLRPAAVVDCVRSD